MSDSWARTGAVPRTCQVNNGGREDRFMSRKKGGVVLALALACGAVMLAVQVLRVPVSTTHWWYRVAELLARFSG